MQDVLALLSGGIVGFTLGLIGGGGSIVAVPLLLYLVGMPDPHVVIGTTSVAVAANALTALLPHARAGNVRWAVARLPDTLVTVVTTPGSLTGLRRDGVYVDNLQVIHDFIAEHPSFLKRYWVQVRRARALIYEQWGSGALAGSRLAQAQRLLLQSCLQWPARRPLLLLGKALLLSVARFF